MSKTLSEGQARSIIGSFVLDTPWNEVKADLQPFIELSPEERGKRFAEFLNNGCQMSVTKSFAPEIPEGKKWIRIDDVIYVKVTSNGRDGEDWITYLESKKFRLRKYTKDILQSLDFKATNGVTYTLAIIIGIAYTDRNRVSKKIRADAKKQGWLTPHPETACLLRCLLSNTELEELGIGWIATMHEPIKDSYDSPGVLCLNSNDGQELDARWDVPDNNWSDRGAFSFLVSQVQN